VIAIASAGFVLRLEWCGGVRLFSITTRLSTRLVYEVRTRR
jgi:hypothetical protein